MKVTPEMRERLRLQAIKRWQRSSYRKQVIKTQKKNKHPWRQDHTGYWNSKTSTL